MTKNLDYLTREFVKKDCSANGAILTDRDCDLIINAVKRLNAAGKFHHTGVYWIANRLAAEGIIKPTFPIFGDTNNEHRRKV